MNFDKFITDAYDKFLLEAQPQPKQVPKQSPQPPPQDPAAQAGGEEQPPQDPNAPAGGQGGAPTPDMGGMEQPAPQPELDNATKSDANPIEYVESVIELLVDPKEGLTPEKFNKFLDSYSFDDEDAAKKDDFKKYYSNFHTKLLAFNQLKNELKRIFPNMQNRLSKLNSTKQYEPDTAGGGVDTGKSSVNGPGVVG